MKTFYRNRLPHLLPVGGTFFVTFCLHPSVADRVSIKKHFLNQTRKAKKPELEDFLDSDAFVDSHSVFDTQLLYSPNAISILQESLHQFDQKWYDLLAYCIMPDHVHLLLDLGVQLEDWEPQKEFPYPPHYVQLNEITRRIKGKSSRLINQAWSRNGPLWQAESFDHYVRNPKELSRIITYIGNNPVTAGLVKGWKDWEGTFVKGG
jgi:putative transposase